MSKLYEFPHEFDALNDLYEQAVADGNITEFEQAFRDTFEGLNAEFDEKVANTGRFIKSLDADAKALKDEADSLTRRMRSLKNRADNLRRYLIKVMQETGKDKSGDTVTPVRVQTNGGLRPLVFEKGAELPDEYKAVEYTPDNAKIREALDAGKELDFVRYGNRTQSLRIG